MRTALCLETFLLQLVVSSPFSLPLLAGDAGDRRWRWMHASGFSMAPRVGVVDIRRFRHVDLHSSCWGFRGALRKIGCVRVFIDSGRAKHRVRQCGHVGEVDCGFQPSCGLVSRSESFGVNYEQGVWTVYLCLPCSRRKGEAPKRLLETFYCRASKVHRFTAYGLWSPPPPSPVPLITTPGVLSSLLTFLCGGVCHVTSFSLLFSPFVSSCDTLNVGSASLPVWLSSEADACSAHQNSIWVNLVLNCCLDISVAAGMEPSRKPCRGIEN
jgi:hypothetical protein